MKLLAVALICGFTMSMTSCADNNDNPVPGKKKYRLVQRKDYYDNSDMYSITDYGYDHQGRLASLYRVLYNSQFGDVFVDADYTYTYEDHCIIEKHSDGFLFRFTLNDEGLIVKEENSKTEGGVTIPNEYPRYFRYDDGRMVEYEETVTQKVDYFHWENGDLLYISDGKDSQQDETDRKEYARTALSVDHGFTNPPLSSINQALFMMGYFGKPSKHLESHYKSMVSSDNISLLFEDDYTYTITDGHITEMVDNSHSHTKYGAIESVTEKKITSTFIYEEY